MVKPRCPTLTRVELAPDEQGVVHLGGPLDIDTVPALYRQTEDLIGARTTLTVDVSGVDRVNSAGLALLLEWLAEAGRRGCTLRFRGWPDSVLAVARLSGVEDLLTGQSPATGPLPDLHA